MTTNVKVAIKGQITIYTVFDAMRDSNGKGIKAKDLVKVLKKTI